MSSGKDKEKLLDEATEALNRSHNAYTDLHSEICKLLIGISSASIGFGIPILTSTSNSIDSDFKIQFVASLILFLYALVLILVHMIIALTTLRWANSKRTKEYDLLKRWIDKSEITVLSKLNKSIVGKKKLSSFIKTVNFSFFIGGSGYFIAGMVLIMKLLLEIGKQ